MEIWQKAGEAYNTCSSGYPTIWYPYFIIFVFSLFYVLDNWALALILPFVISIFYHSAIPYVHRIMNNKKTDLDFYAGVMRDNWQRVLLLALLELGCVLAVPVFVCILLVMPIVVLSSVLNGAKLFWLTLLALCVTLAAFGFMLFLPLSFVYTDVLLMLKGLSPFDSIRESVRIMRSNFWVTLKLVGVYIAVYLPLVILIPFVSFLAPTWKTAVASVLSLLLGAGLGPWYTALKIKVFEGITSSGGGGKKPKTKAAKVRRKKVGAWVRL